MGWSDEEITARLFVEHEPEPAPVAVVFASVDATLRKSRVTRAIALHAGGFARRLLMTGGPIRDTSTTEAGEMAMYARAEGVPAADLLIEERSTNTCENARFCVELLTSLGLFRRTAALLLVLSPWHLGRVVLTMERQVPPGTRLLAIPCDEPCRRATWALSPECRTVVASEALIFEAFLSAGLLSGR